MKRQLSREYIDKVSRNKCAFHLNMPLFLTQEKQFALSNFLNSIIKSIILECLKVFKFTEEKILK